MVEESTPLLAKKFATPLADLLTRAEEISSPKHRALISITKVISPQGGHFNALAHLSAFVESSSITSFPCPTEFHMVKALLIQRSSALFESLYPTGSEKAKKVLPL